MQADSVLEAACNVRILWPMVKYADLMPTTVRPRQIRSGSQNVINKRPCAPLLHPATINKRLAHRIAHAFFIYLLGLRKHIAESMLKAI